MDECAIQIVTRVINNDKFQSKEGKSKAQYWNDLCDLISTNPRQIKSLNVDAIIRDGIGRFPEQRGRLWNALSDYYIRSGQFERARDIYEEAIDTVTAVRDFTQIFDAYAQFEETTLSAKMESVAKNEMSSEDDEFDIEVRMARLEQLIERRPLLVNRSVIFTGRYRCYNCRIFRKLHIYAFCDAFANFTVFCYGKIHTTSQNGINEWN